MANNNYHKKVGNYIFIQPIGRGAFAEVHKGVHQTTNEEVAIKMMSRAKSSDESTQIEKEIRILREFNHTNIVRFLDYQKTQNHYYLIFEFCKHGDLEHFIREFYNGRVPEFDAQKLVQQIIEGIKSMKGKNIVHRDLKLANILVSKDFILKIADFGLARYLEKDDFLLKTMVGTPLNMDPHILERKGYNEKCDIWSLGVIFYQILVGKPPYNPGRGAGIEDLLALIKRQPVVFPADIPLSDSVKQLIKSMLVYDLNKRMSFEELFQHEWITGKFVIEDPSKASSMSDLSATQLLQSMYDRRKTQTKKPRAKTGQSSPPGQDKPKGQEAGTINDGVVKVESVSSKTFNLKEASSQDIERELYGAAFLAKAYETFRNKIYKLREYLMKVRNMSIPSDAFDDERVSIVQILVSMEMLKMLREILGSRFAVFNEVNQAKVFDDDFKTFWDKIVAAKLEIENFYSSDDVTLEIADLYNQVKSDYLETFESMTTKIDGLKTTFDRFKGHNLEKLIMDCLIQLSENSAYQDYLEENLESKIDKYNTCFEICEFMLFRNNFQFVDFKIIHKNEKKQEEEKETNADQQNLLSFTTEIFQKDFSFKFLKELSQNNDYKKRFNQIKNSIILSESDQKDSNELNVTLRKFQSLVSKRISDLKEKVEIDFSS